MSYSTCKNVEEYWGKSAGVLAELKAQEVTIEDAVTMKAMNSLRNMFSMYMTILNEGAWNSNKMPTLDEFFKKLEDEKC